MTRKHALVKERKTSLSDAFLVESVFSWASSFSWHMRVFLDKCEFSFPTFFISFIISQPSVKTSNRSVNSSLCPGKTYIAHLPDDGPLAVPELSARGLVVLVQAVYRLVQDTLLDTQHLAQG